MNQLGVPEVEECNLRGFCRDVLPDPECHGGPQHWNDLANYWEYGFTGSGAGGKKTFTRDWNINQHPWEGTPQYQPQYLDMFLKVRGVRDKFGQFQ